MQIINVTKYCFECVSDNGDTTSQHYLHYFCFEIINNGHFGKTGVPKVPSVLL